MDRLSKGCHTQWLIVLLCMVIVSCSQSKAVGRVETEPYPVAPSGDSIPYAQIGQVDGNRLLIYRDIDLKGAVCVIPKGITLCSKGGIIQNGVLVGHNTQIRAKGVLFDKVMIKGRWNVPYISTTLFYDLSYENALRDVIALADASVNNIVVIEKGDYCVKAEKNADVGLSLCSNTQFVLKGTIRLLPNSYRNYYIVRANGKNIHISGKGIIMGDKLTHTGTTGEWGMGIEFREAVNSSIKGLTITDCWGDCIYVGGGSRDVLIEKCTLDNGRRQGISITNANSVTIRKCLITNVSGTNPQYAIDVEPNKKDSVDNILIEDVVVRDCEGGIKATRGNQKEDANTPWIGQVTIRNCQVSCKSKVPVIIRRCEKAIVNNCTLSWSRGKTAMVFLEVDQAEAEDNTFIPKGDIYEIIRQMVKETVGRDEGRLIRVEVVGQHSLKNNKINGL